jgi:hypothetical protein
MNMKPKHEFSQGHGHGHGHGHRHGLYRGSCLCFCRSSSLDPNDLVCIRARVHVLWSRDNFQHLKIDV